MANYIYTRGLNLFAHVPADCNFPLGLLSVGHLLMFINTNLQYDTEALEYY